MRGRDSNQGLTDCSPGARVVGIEIRRTHVLNAHTFDVTDEWVAAASCGESPRFESVTGRWLSRLKLFAVWPSNHGKK